MKKVLLAAFAALAITSCSQNEEFDNQSANNEIKIGTVVKNSTRASVVNNDNFFKFKVYSYVSDGNYTGASELGSALMNGVEYTNNEGTWGTTDTGKYYWPDASSLQKLQFFAYPNDLVTDYALPAAGTAGFPSFTYTVADSYDLQKDLVVAYEQDKTKESEGVTNGKLTLNFKHILTRVNFAFIPADETATYKITSVKVSGLIGGKAKYTFGTNNGWDLTNATTGKEYTYNVKQAESKVLSKDYYMLGDAAASLMLLPQDVSGKTITIGYSTKVGSINTFAGTKNVNIPSTSTWTAGQNVLYVLTLPVGGTEVTVTPIVGDWATLPDEKPATIQ